MKTVEISVGEDFSKSPFGRYKSDGQFNAERFREELLVPELRKGNKVKIYLDTVDEYYEYGSSFFDEVFAGLIRKEGFSKKDIFDLIIIETSKADYILEINEYIEEASTESK